MNIFIPIISATLFHLGGRDQFKWCPLNQKWWRWGMGLPIAVIMGYLTNSLTPYLCLVTYFLATNVSGYGENHPFRKWFGRDFTWVIYGVLLGTAALPSLSLRITALQSALCGLAFWALMKWSNDGFGGNKLNHKLVEIATGLIATLGFLCV